MEIGKLNKRVSLSRSPSESDDSDGFFEPLSPAEVWAQIQPFAPQGDGRTVTSLVTMRYHAGVTMDTRIVYGVRELFVKGFQNVDEAGTELKLLCEEVVN